MAEANPPTQTKEADERVGENEDETVVKLPTGQKIAMLSPYKDGGDVPWLVPKRERDLEYFEIPWDELIDEKERKLGLDQVVVLSQNPLDNPKDFDLSQPRIQHVFKSRCDAFNSKHIIDAVIREKVAEKREPVRASIGSGDGLADEFRLISRRSILVHSKKPQKIFRPSKQSRLAELIYNLENVPDNGMPNRIFELIDSEIEKEKLVIADRKRRKELRRLREIEAVNRNDEISMYGEFEEEILEEEHGFRTLTENYQQYPSLGAVNSENIPPSSGTSHTAEVGRHSVDSIDVEDDSRMIFESVGFRELEDREKILHEIERRENIEKKRRKELRERAVDRMKEQLLARLRRERVENIEKIVNQSSTEVPSPQKPETSESPFDLCRLILLKRPYLLKLVPGSWTVQDFCNYLFSSQQKSLTSWQSGYSVWRDARIRETLRFHLQEIASSLGWLSSPYYQFAVDSGLILASSGKTHKRKLLDYLSSPDYAEKKEKYGNILVGGVLSEDRMQELVALGIVEQDPFLKDLLEISRGKREERSTAKNLSSEVYGEELNENELVKAAEGNVSEGESENAGSSAETASTVPSTSQPVSTETPAENRGAENVSEGETDVEIGGKTAEDKSEMRKAAETESESEEIRKIFGEQLFHLVWVHPKNFKRLFDEAKSFDDEGGSKATDLRAFVDSWKMEWKELMSSMVEDDLKRFEKVAGDGKQRKAETYTRAFLRRLKTHNASGCVPSFLLEGLAFDEGGQSSYLKFLERMKEAYSKHLAADKEKMNRLITYLKGILAELQRERRTSKDESAKGFTRSDNEGEEEVRDEEKGGETRKTGKSSHKTKFNVRFNRAYTLQDLMDGNVSKGPLFIDNELKGLDEAQVKAMYRKNSIPTETPASPSKRFSEWLRHRVDGKKKLNSDLLLMNEVESYKRIQAVDCYVTLVNSLKSMEHRPDDFKFLFRRFEHYIGPEFAELHRKYDLGNLNDFTSREKGDFHGLHNRTGSPYFHKPLLDVWKPQNALDGPQPLVTVSDVADKISRGETNVRSFIPTIADQIYGNLIPMVQDQFVNVYLDPRGGNHEERELSTEEEVENEFDPFFCPKIGPTQFKYDPYGCIRKDPKVKFKEQIWYKSGRERAMRAFREQHDSFFKYIDVNRLERESSGFGVWKMAASGKLFEMYEKFDNPLERDAEEQQQERFAPEMAYNPQDAVGLMKELGYLKQPDGDGKISTTEDQASLAADRVLRYLFKKYMPLRTYNKKYEPISVKEQIKPAERYIVFSTVSCNNQQRSKTLNSVDDNTLFNVLNACGTLIFDITRSKSDIYLCCWYLRKLFLKREKLRQRKEKDDETRLRDFEDKDLQNAKRSSEQQFESVELERPEQHIILITNFMSWADSPEPVKVEMNAKNFYSRKPHVDYRDYYTFENLIYRIGRRKPFNIRTTVVYTGLTFGHEEDGLVYVFKMAYENQREIPIYGPGNNFPPMVHVEDLSKVVASLVSSNHDPMVFVVQKIRRSLKKRVFSIAAHISYSHVRTSPTSFYEWNNMLPKNVHDVLQLNVKAKHVDLHPLMRTPKIPKPFSRGKEGYQLIRELKTSRGIEVRTVLFIGAPSKVKWDLAKAISVLYGIPLITRRNIMTEWLKIRQCLQEMKKIRKGPDEQNPDDEKDKPSPSSTLDEVKQVVLEDNCDVNRHWLLIHLKMILRTVRYRKVGYVLCDVPLSEKDAEFVFNNRPHKPEPKRFHDLSVFTRTPAKVIFLEMNQFNNQHPYEPNADPVVSDDWDDFWNFHNSKSDALMFFKRRLRPVHQLSVYDELLLQKVVKIIGPPPRPGGDRMFERIMSSEMADIFVQPMEKNEKLQNFDSIDTANVDSRQLPEPLHPSCLPLYQNVHRYYLHVSAEDEAVGLGSGAAPYKSMRRRWCGKSDLFTRIPSTSVEPVWDMARKFWNPKKENKEYSISNEI